MNVKKLDEKQNKEQNKKKPVADVNFWAHGVAVSILLLVLVGFLGFVLYSFEGVLLDATVDSTRGEVYVGVGCGNSSACLEESERVRAKHGGEDVGTVKLYQSTQIGGGYWQVNSEAVADFLMVNTQDVPDDKIPVLMSDAVEPAELNEKFWPVGNYVGSSFDGVDVHAGMFTPIVELLTWAKRVTYMVDDGTGRIEKFLLGQLSEHESAGTDVKDLNELVADKKQVVKFDNYADALAYRRDMSSNQQATVVDLFGSVLEIDSVFSGIYVVFWVIMGLLVVVAVVVILLLLDLQRRRAATKRRK